LRKQTGRIYFWKYKTDGWIGSEWHLSADDNGFNYLMHVFERMSCSETGIEQDVVITPVTQRILAIPEYDSPVKNVPRLVLKFHPFDSNYYDWSIKDNKSCLEISFGRAILEQWRQILNFGDARNTDENIIGLNEEHSILVWKN